MSIILFASRAFCSCFSIVVFIGASHPLRLTNREVLPTLFGAARPARHTNRFPSENSEGIREGYDLIACVHADLGICRWH